ncbi:putative ribonuclease H-like domain-containing protein [Tanacetum coccineum]
MSGKESAPQMAPVESPQMISTVKLPILKKGEYTLWSMRMEQYLTNTDYGLWQVIMNGDEPVQTIKDDNGVETEVPPKTAQAILARQKERKAKSILLLAIPDEYQLRFHTIKDAKSLLAAIKSRFGGNVESKKMQKNVLKQQFENFSVSDTEGLDKAYDRFQKLISQLEVHGAAVSNEDANQKFLRALPSSWNNIALIMRNKEGIDELDIDDLYNNLKVFDADIKVGHSSQGQAYSSSYTDDLMFSFFAYQSNSFDKTKDNALIMQDGLGYDWSYIAQDEPTEFALMAYTSGSDSKLGLESVEAQLIIHQKNEAVYEEKIAVLEFEVKDKGYGDQLNENDSSGSELFNSVFDSRSSNGDDNQTNDMFKKDNGYHVVPPPLTGNYMPPLADVSFVGLDDSIYRPTTNKTSASVPSGVIIKDWASDNDEDIFQSNDVQTTVKPSFKKIQFTKVRNEPVKSNKQAVKPRMVTQSPKIMPKESVLGKGTGHREVRPIWNNTQRINHQNKFVPTAVLTRSGRIPVSTAKQPFYKSTILNTKVSKEKVNTVRVNGVNTARQIAVSTVKGNEVTAVKGSIGCVWRPKMTDLNNGSKDNSGSWTSKRGNPQRDLKYKGMFDSGCSRVPRQNNMYSFDLKNVVPSGYLTYLFAKATIDESKLWHRRLGHVNFKTMNKLVKGNLVRGLPSKTFENDHTCVACQKGKQHKASCKTKHVSSISQPLQMLHMDLFGPTSVRSINHKTYCLIVTDDFSREMDEFCRQKGIKREYSVARTPQQNRVVERKNRTLIEAARTMLADLLLPIVFWAEAVNTVCYVLNRVLVTKPHNKTPYELIIGRTPSISFIRPFGCPITILNTLDPLGKFDGKAEEGFLVRYSVNSKTFRVFNTETRKVKENLHVNFLENKPNVAGQGPNWLFNINSLTNSMNYQPVIAGNQTNKNAGPQKTNGNTSLKKNVDSGQSEEENVSIQQYIVFPLWSSISSNYKSSDDKAEDDTIDDDACKKTVQELASEYDQALKNVLDKMMDQEKEATEQSDAVRKEFEAQCDSQLLQEKITRASSTNSFNIVSTPVNTVSVSRTFSPVGPSSGPSFVPFGGSSPIDIANLPHDPLMPKLEDTAEIRKVDFNNMEPSTVVSPIPTTRVHSIHPKAQIIRDPKSAIEAMQEELLQFKIQKVWTLVDLPSGKKVIGTKWVYRNKKDERGIVVRNKARLVAQVYKQEEGIDYDEVFALVARVEAIRLFLAFASFMNFLVYQIDVKSAFLYGTIEEEIMHNRFQMSSIGELTFFLGLQVKQKEDGIFISQDMYVDEILKTFVFFSIRSANTSMERHKALTKDEDGEDVDVNLYRSMIGSPKVSHLKTVKRIFRYLKGQPKLGLWYPKESPLILEAFSDNDYASASLDRKSTKGGCQFLGSRLISWQCKKQIVVANSTTEAEYIDASYYCGQVLWIQNQMLDYGFNFMQTKIHVDNESAICVVKNLVYHSKTKHIETRHHFIRDFYEKILIEMVKIHTNHNVVDLLTKAFDVSRFKFLVASIGKRGRDTKIPQSGGPPIKVGDEAVHKELGDRMERAATTASCLEAEQDSDAQTRFEAASKSSMTHLSQELTHLEVGRTFWETASATTNQNGEMEITATTVTEASPSLSSPTQQSPPSMYITHDAKEPATMPHDSPLQRV